MRRYNYASLLTDPKTDQSGGGAILSSTNPLNRGLSDAAKYSGGKTGVVGDSVGGSTSARAPSSILQNGQLLQHSRSGFGNSLNATALGGGSGGGGGGGGIANGAVGGDLGKYQNEANAANEARYQQLLDLAGQVGHGAMATAQWNQQVGLGSVNQRAISSGLGNSTILPNMEAGVNAQASAAMGAARDQGLAAQMGVIERRQDQGPDYGLLASLASRPGANGGGGGGVVGGRPRPGASGGQVGNFSSLSTGDGTFSQGGAGGGSLGGQGGGPSPQGQGQWSTSNMINNPNFNGGGPLPTSGSPVGIENMLGRWQADSRPPEAAGYDDQGYPIDMNGNRLT